MAGSSSSSSNSWWPVRRSTLAVDAYLPLPVSSSSSSRAGSAAGTSTGSQSSGSSDNGELEMEMEMDFEDDSSSSSQEGDTLLLDEKRALAKAERRRRNGNKHKHKHAHGQMQGSKRRLRDSLSSSSSSSSSCYPPSSSLLFGQLCGPSPTTGHGRRSSKLYILVVVVQLAILVLALVGTAGIVAFATGLLQRTPIYGEKALADSGWARRPIMLDSHSLAEGQGQARAGPGSASGQSSTDLSLSGSSGSSSRVTIHDFTPSSSSLSSASAAAPISSLHLLILCPLRNAASDLPRLFSLLDGFTHPFANTSLGFLVGDEDDNTGEVLRDLVMQRTIQREQGESYRHVTMLHKDFKVEMPSGANRHSYLLQSQRRTVMARARTYLLTATLEPSVDWVLWLDSDVAELSPSLFEDLLIYGGAGVSPSAPLGAPSHAGADVSASANAPAPAWNDVIVPNALKRRPDGSLMGFDMNNWAETPESLKLRGQLAPEDLLIEGNIWQHMHRLHLADMYVPYTPSAPEVFSSAGAPLRADDQRLNVTSDAYIGKQVELDGIGGVAALVRAEAHRMGAIFPSWVFENQLETEAFGVLAKKLGARVVGLPNLFVLHKSS